MASTTINTTAAQDARILQALAKYNAAHGQSLTPKQWLYVLIREAVMRELADGPAQAARAEEAAGLRTIADDLLGGT